jgi:hypothetical protein
MKRAEYQRICGHPDGYKLPFDSENAMKTMSTTYQNEGSDMDDFEVHAARAKRGNSLAGNMRERLGDVQHKLLDKVDGAIPVSVREGILGTRQALGQASRTVMAALEGAATAGIHGNAPNELLE